jgi:hypothetical protein
VVGMSDTSNTVEKRIHEIYTTEVSFGKQIEKIDGFLKEFKAAQNEPKKQKKSNKTPDIKNKS